MVSDSFADPVSDNISAILQVESAVMASSDLYLVFGALAIVLIPLVLVMQRIPAPQIRKA